MRGMTQRVPYKGDGLLSPQVRTISNVESSSSPSRSPKIEGLFVYGTLMFPEVISALLGSSDVLTRAIPCTLSGFQRVSLEGRAYPGLLKLDEHAEVLGLLIPILKPEDWIILDDYEGEEYDLVDVIVWSEVDLPIEHALGSPCTGNDINSSCSVKTQHFHALTFALNRTDLAKPDSAWDPEKCRVESLPWTLSFTEIFRLEWVENKRRTEISRLIELKRRLKKEWDDYEEEKGCYYDAPLLSREEISTFYPYGPHSLVGAGERRLNT